MVKAHLIPKPVSRQPSTDDGWHGDLDGIKRHGDGHVAVVALGAKRAVSWPGSLGWVVWWGGVWSSVLLPARDRVHEPPVIVRGPRDGSHTAYATEQ